MPVGLDPRVLAQIGNPMAGLGQIGTAYAQGAEMKQNRELMEMKREQMQMEKLINDEKLTAAQMENMVNESKGVMGVTTALMEEFKENPEILRDPKKYKQYMSSLDIPEDIAENFQGVMPTPKNIAALNRKAGAMVAAYNEKEQKSLKKWETELLMIQQKNEHPEMWNETKQQQLEALQRQETIAFDLSSPSNARTRYYDTAMGTLKLGDDLLKGNIENEDVYREALGAEQRRILQENEAEVKQGKARAISENEAFAMAHEKLKSGLKQSDVVGDITEKIPGVGRVDNPLGKKYVYDPVEASKESTEEVSTEGKKPQDLKEGESGVFGDYEYKRENGTLSRRKLNG